VQLICTFQLQSSTQYIITGESLEHDIVNKFNLIRDSSRFKTKKVSKNIFIIIITDREKNKLLPVLNLLRPTGYVMHHQVNIQQLYALTTLYLCVLYLSENKQLLVPLTA